MKLTKLSRVMVVITVVMIVNALSYGTIIPLLYPYAKRFGFSAATMSLLFASFSLAQFLATPIIGRLSDKYGRKPLLVLSLLGTSVSLALFASAQSAVMLFVARILDGITGGNISVAQAMLSDVSSEEDRSKVFGILGAVFGLGFIIGPAIGGVLGSFGLTAPFWFASGLALAGTVLGMVMLSETNKTREVKKAVQFIDLEVLKKVVASKSVGRLLGLSFLVMTAVNAMILGFQSYTVDVLKLTELQIGLLFAQFGVVQVIIQGFGIRWLLKTFTNQRSLIEGLLWLAAIMIVIPSLVGNLWWFSAWLLVYGIVSSPLSALIIGRISVATDATDQGGVLGLNQSLTSLAQIVGPLTAGLMLKIGGVRWPFFLAGGLYGVCAVVFLLVRSQKKLNV